MEGSQVKVGREVRVHGWVSSQEGTRFHTQDEKPGSAARAGVGRFCKTEGYVKSDEFLGALQKNNEKRGDINGRKNIFQQKRKSTSHTTQWAVRADKTQPVVVFRFGIRNRWELSGNKLVDNGEKWRILDYVGFGWVANGIKLVLPLTGRYACQLDANNRLAVPAKLREQLGQGAEAYWYVSVGQRTGSLDLWPEEIFKDLANQLPSSMLSSEAALKFEEFLYSHSERVRMDKQGRVVVPEMLLAEVALGKELMLVGQRNRMTIWPRALWEQVEKEQMTQQANIREQARLALQAVGK